MRRPAQSLQQRRSDLCAVRDVASRGRRHRRRAGNSSIGDGVAALAERERISPPRARLGQVLREYRAARGMTQEQLAVLLGFDQSYMSKVESGTREIRETEALWRLC